MALKYKLVLWDLDNTLFDFDSAEENAIKRLYGEYGIPFNGEEDLENFRRVNDSWWKKYELGEVEKDELMLSRWRELFSQHDMDYQKFNDSYLDYLAVMKHPFPDAEDVVRQLDALGCIQAIVTNGAKTTQDRSYWPSVIASYIKTMVISDEVGIAKPDPRIFALACEKAGWQDKATILMVGDSVSSDVAGGIAYGIDTCFYNPKGIVKQPMPAKYEIHCLEEVIRIVTK